MRDFQTLLLTTHLQFKHKVFACDVSTRFFKCFSKSSDVDQDLHTGYFRLVFQNRRCMLHHRTVLASSPVVDNVLVSVVHAEGVLYGGTLGHKLDRPSCVC